MSNYLRLGCVAHSFSLSPPLTAIGGRRRSPSLFADDGMRRGMALQIETAMCCKSQCFYGKKSVAKMLAAPRPQMQ